MTAPNTTEPAPGSTAAAAATDAEAQASEPAEIPPVRSGQLVRVESPEPDGDGSIAAFASLNNFRAAQSMALSLAASSLVPAAYRGKANVGNCLVALELAGRVRASVLMVMQNLFVIEGKPSWSSAFQIAAVNSCGRFTPLRFVFTGTANTDDWACRAIARDIKTGETLEGEPITLKMVKAEGWLGRKGSKWQTMPGQMFRYRAAAFWARVYAPEITLGMHTADEVEDYTGAVTPTSPGARDLSAALRVSSADNSARIEQRAEQDTEPAVWEGPGNCEACNASPNERHGSACPLA